MATEEELSPYEAAAEKRLHDADEYKRELEQQGWVWRGDGVDKVLSHPDDLDLNIWFHPYTGEQLLSPKLVESIKRQFRAE